MEDLTTRMCWKLVKKEGYIAIWQKPLNNSCYLNRDTGLKPLLCDGNDEPDDVWYVLSHSSNFPHNHSLLQEGFFTIVLRETTTDLVKDGWLIKI